MKVLRRLGGLLTIAALVAFGASACEAPPGGTPTRLEVSLADQRVRIYSNDTLLQDFPISSGRNHSTPKGRFSVVSKSPSTTSLTDPAVSMRYMTRFTKTIGFHGIPRKNGRALPTPLGERAVSHGCIRMNDDDAAWIYHNVGKGTPVIVK